MLRMRAGRSLPVLVLAALAFVVGVCLYAVGLLPSGEQAKASTSQGPIAAYSFDEGTGTTATDITGDGHTGTLNHAGYNEAPEWSNGKYGGALRFQGGSEQCVTVPASPDLQLREEFTLETWVKPEGSGEKEPLIYKEENTASANGDYAIYLGFEGNGELDGFIEEGGWQNNEVSSGKLPTHVWSHVALTFDGAKLRLYVNGALLDTTASGEPFGSESQLSFGCAENLGDDFQGKLDEVRIYNRALNAGEVGADMAAPLETPQAAPIAAYSFDEGEGTTVKDLSGNGHTGELEHAEWNEPPQWSKGKYGGGLYFEGQSEECVRVPEATDLELTEEFTIETWVKPEGSGESEPLVYKESPNPASDFAYSLYLGLEGNEVGGYVEEGEWEKREVTASKLPKNVWSHVALAFDGAHLRLYVNGALVDTTAAEGAQATASDLRFGCAGNRGENFKGNLDELRIYNRALSAGEVQGDMAAPLETPQAGPIAAYSFDEGTGTTATDITGDGHTGTLNHAGYNEAPEWSNGKYGGALRFQGGSEQCVTVPASPDLQLREEFTLETWVKPEGSGEKEPLIYKEENTASANGDYAIYLGYEANGELDGFIEEGGWQNNEVSSGKLPTHVWSHVALTFDGAKLRLYVNGALLDTTASGEPFGSESQLTFGCAENLGDDLQGRLDEVRIYNRALNANEVGADMAAPIQTPQQGPVAAYSFDEGTGTTATDITGDGHTATLHGAKWTTHGRYGGAMEFASSEHAYLSIPDSPELALSEELTLEAWVRPATPTHNWEPVLGKTTGTGEALGTHTFSYYLYAGDYEKKPFGEVENPLANEYRVTGPEALPENAWSHLALTYDGSIERLYVNGAKVAEGAAPSPVSTSGQLEIGAETEHGDYMNGRVDEVRIYNRALGAAEVGADMEAPIQTPQQGPVAAYSFDEGTGTTAVDMTGAGHTATISGATWTNGRYGNALKFNGTSACVSIADAEDLRLGEGFTLESWVRPEGEVIKDPIVFKEGSSYLNYALDIGHTTTGKPEGSIGITASPHQKEAASTASLGANVWSHLATTYDGAKLRLYVNGELVSTQTVTGSNSGREGALKIGCDTQYGEHFRGKIDEVRIYNRALGAGEIGRDMVTNTDEYPPHLSLTGALTEGLKEGQTAYPLTVRAADGDLEHTGIGMGTIEIAVDGHLERTAHQRCATSNCEQELSWTYNTFMYEGSEHFVSITAEDLAGNVTTEVLTINPPNGAIPACRPDGSEPVSSPTSTSALPDGGQLEIYEGAEESEFGFPKPPEGFAPATASAEELREYGFPLRPEGEAARENWAKAMNAYTEVPSGIGCAVPKISYYPPTSQNSPDPEKSGYIAEAGETHEAYWDGASVNYVQPELNTKACKNTRFSAWVALGGGNSGFFQAGTNFDATGHVASFGEFFVAGPFVPSDAPVEQRLGIKAGDEIYTSVNWNSSLKEAEGFVQDLRNGHAKPFFRKQQPGQDLYNGSLAENFIEASHTPAGNAYGLTKFTPFSWSESWLYQSGESVSSEPLGHAPFLYRIFMRRGNATLAYPSILGPDHRSFNEVFHQCRP